MLEGSVRAPSTAEINGNGKVDIAFTAQAGNTDVTDGGRAFGDPTFQYLLGPAEESLCRWSQNESGKFGSKRTPITRGHSRSLQTSRWILLSLRSCGSLPSRGLSLSQ